MPILAEVSLLDEILDRFRAAIGADFTAYRNHTYRVLNFCSALSPIDDEDREKAVIAAAFHDLGIWTDATFDYLAPSERLAHAYLSAQGRGAWADEITAMIENHHKITPARAGARLVETFRKADWIDVTRGIRSFGLPRSFLRKVFHRFPNAGFHKRLLQLWWQRALRHPLSPLPMYRL